MKRTILLASLVILIVGMAGAAVAVPTYVAEIEDRHLTEVSPGRFRVDQINGLAACPDGVTFLGRVNVRQHGEVVYLGKISGTCNSSWQSGPDRVLGLLDCASFTARGQMRFSDGKTLTMAPKVYDNPC